MPNLQLSRKEVNRHDQEAQEAAASCCQPRLPTAPHAVQRPAAGPEAGKTSTSSCTSRWQPALKPLSAYPTPAKDATCSRCSCPGAHATTRGSRHERSDPRSFCRLAFRGARRAPVSSKTCRRRSRRAHRQRARLVVPSRSDLLLRNFTELVGGPLGPVGARDRLPRRVHRGTGADHPDGAGRPGWHRCQGLLPGQRLGDPRPVLLHLLFRLPGALPQPRPGRRTPSPSSAREPFRVPGPDGAHRRGDGLAGPRDRASRMPGFWATSTSMPP